MTRFRFEKTGVLIARPPEMPAPGPYYSCVVDMAGVAGFPADYALYCSSDHHGGEGGIWLFVCDGAPSDPGNWRSYDQAVAAGAFDHLAERPAGNPIFRDPVQGNGHTETPHAQVIDGRVMLSYHKNGIGPSQATLLATSADGVGFARINGSEDSVILSYDVERDVGDGHTGYFRWARNPFAGIDHTWIGYSLHGGGADFHSALWASDDARAWTRLAILPPVPVPDWPGAAVDLEVVWHEIDPASARPTADGGAAVIGCVSSRASGAEARVVELCELSLGPDGVTFTQSPRPLLARGVAGDSDAEELASPSVVLHAGVPHLVYVGACDGGGTNAIMGAIGG